jgi:hypothetical protein
VSEEARRLSEYLNEQGITGEAMEALYRDTYLFREEMDAILGCMPLSESSSEQRIRYCVALQRIASFFEHALRQPFIAHNLTTLANALLQLNEGVVTQLLARPAISNRPKEADEIWISRARVVLGLECLVQGGQTRKKAAEFIARKYPDLKGLQQGGTKANTSLAKNILSWDTRFRDESLRDGGAIDAFQILRSKIIFDLSSLPAAERRAKSGFHLETAQEEARAINPRP